jgi:GPI inositol-deacylase
MRRRPSGSAVEDDEEDTSNSERASPSTHADKAHAPVADRTQLPSAPGHPKARRRNEDASSRASSKSSQSWRQAQTTSTGLEKDQIAMSIFTKDTGGDTMQEGINRRRARWRNPWAFSLLTFLTTVTAAVMLGIMAHSFLHRQIDTKGCRMCYMRPAFKKYSDFDTEHTRFASKYSLYLYREGVIDEDPMVIHSKLSLTLGWLKS